MALLGNPPSDPKKAATPAVLTAWSKTPSLTSTVKITHTTRRDATARQWPTAMRYPQ
jgi:hypothetical protein